MYSSSPKQPFQAYANAAMTVSKTRQVVMLYDGMIRFVQQAIEAIGQKDYEARFNLLAKTSAILNGLQNSLDYEQGGEIARILDGFYAALDAKISRVHHTNDVQALESALKELRNMRDAWQTIDSQMGQNEQAATEPSKPVQNKPAASTPTQEQIAAMLAAGVSA